MKKLGICSQPFDSPACPSNSLRMVPGMVSPSIETPAEFVGRTRNRESSCHSMETSEYRPNDADETPGGTAKTPGLPWRIAVCSILPVLPLHKWEN